MKRVLDSAQNKAKSFLAAVDGGTKAYQWANCEQHVGKLKKQMMELEAKLDEHDREILLQRADILKARHTGPRLVQHIGNYLKKEPLFNMLEKSMSKLMAHHEIENAEE